MLKIFEDSKNYTAQVVKLPVKQAVVGLDNLVKVNIQGNDCLISKDSPEDELYLFFPAECQLSEQFLKKNNLYRDTSLNEDSTKKGYFEPNGRCKSMKFKGVISTCFIIPISSLNYLVNENLIDASDITDLRLGNEFNELWNQEICRKYIKKTNGNKSFSNPRVKIIDSVVDSKLAPQHFDTEHLLKNVHKLNLSDYVAVTYKLHGTSARYYHTLTKRKLGLIDRLAKFCGVKIQEEEYNYIAGSRKVIKSVGFEELPDKNHFYTSGDLWSEVGKEYFEGKLNQGEAVYCEIIGKTYPQNKKDINNKQFVETGGLLEGCAIQHGYTYGFEKPKVYIYRISNINPHGIEIDLPYLQMKERAVQLGIETCPELFYGTLDDFIASFHGKRVSDDRDTEVFLENIFYNMLLEKPSILDSSVVEEGFCLRFDKFPKPEIFKIKSRQFLLHESGLKDKDINDIEENGTEQPIEQSEAITS